MQHEVREAIETVVSQVMEQMAFVFIDPAGEDDLPKAVEALLHVTLAFGGAGAGRLTLATTREVAMEVAENLAGDDEATQEVGEQALMELANVICGRLLTEVAGEAPVFDLQPPELVALDSGAAKAVMSDTDAGAAVFLAGDQPMLVRFEMSDAAG